MSLHFRQLSVFLLLWNLISSCTRWQNQVNWNRYECGTGWHEGEGVLVRLQDPEGRPMNGDELDVRVDGNPLPVSQFGCVLVSEDQNSQVRIEAVSRTRALGLQWPLAETSSGKKNLRALHEPLPLSFDCQLDEEINNPLLLVTALQEKTRDVFVREIEGEVRRARYLLYRTEGGRELERAVEAHGVTSVLEAMRKSLEVTAPREGSYRAQLEVESIRGLSYTIESTCARRLDMSPPELAPLPSDETWLRAGDFVRLPSLADGEILSCWSAQIPRAPGCRQLDEFQLAGGVIEPPGPGAWDLHLIARDRLGNISGDRVEHVWVDDKAPEIKVSWESKQGFAILRDLDLSQSVHVELSDNSSVLGDGGEEYLRDRLECRAEFVRADEGRIAGDMVICDSGLCEGKSLATWQACSTDFRIRWQKENVPLDTQFRMLVRSEDKVGWHSEATLMAMVARGVLNPWYKDETFPLQTSLSRGAVRLIRDDVDRVSYALVRADRNSPYQLALNIAEDEEWYGPAPLEGAEGFLERAGPRALLAAAARLRESEGSKIWVARRGVFPEVLRVDHPLSRTGSPRPTTRIVLAENLRAQIGPDSAVMDMITLQKDKVLLFTVWDQKQLSLLRYDGKDWTMLWQSQGEIEAGFVPQVRVIERGSDFILGVRNEIWILEAQGNGFQAHLRLKLEKLISDISLIPDTQDLLLTQFDGLSKLLTWDESLQLWQEKPVAQPKMAASVRVSEWKHVFDSKGRVYLIADTQGEGTPLVYRLRRLKEEVEWQPILSWLPYDFQSADETFPLTDMLDDGRGGLLFSSRVGVFRRKTSCWVESDPILTIDQVHSRYRVRPFGPRIVYSRGTKGEMLQIVELQSREWLFRKLGDLGWQYESLPQWPEGLLRPVEIAPTATQALWVSFNTGGLYHLERKAEDNWELSSAVAEGLTSFGWQESDGHVWARVGEQVFRLDPTQNKVEKSLLKALPLLSVNDKVWGIGPDGELLQLDAQTGTSRGFMGGLGIRDKINTLVEYPKGVLTAVVERTTQNRRRYTWLASFDRNSEQWKLWPEAQQPKYSIEGLLQLDHNGHLWGETLASGSNSAVAVRWDGQDWRYFMPQDISRNKPMSLTIDASGQVWGNAEGALLLFDEECDAKLESETEGRSAP